MLIEIKALVQELPAVANLSVTELCELSAALGFPVDGVSQEGGETVIEVDVTANRGDVLSHRGFARDLAARVDGKLEPLACPTLEEGAPLMPIHLRAGAACPVYSTAVLDLGEGPGTPEEARRFLASMGTNAKGFAPVDGSNELLFRYGHPTHAFDADRLKGCLIVRWAEEGETLLTLDGVERKLSPKDLLIADDSGPVALAGVMGGDSTKVTPETRRVLLESAWFDARSVRATAHRHGLHSDASYRFGRGADPAMARTGRDLLARRLMDWGGAVLHGAWTAGEVPEASAAIRLTEGTLNRLTGSPISLEEAKPLLERLGFVVSQGADGLWAHPPTWRHDMEIEVDLAEEVLRMRGYDTIPMALPPLQGHPEPLSANYAQRKNLALRLAHLGFHQTVTLGFVSPEIDAEFMSVLGVDNPQGGRTLVNPLGVEYSVMRGSLLPSLRSTAEYNLRQGARELRLFEISPVYFSTPKGPQETLKLGIVWSGTLGGESYLSPARPVRSADLVGIARDLGLEVLPQVHELGDGVFGIEFPLGELGRPQDRIIPAFQAFSRFPAVERDLSLLVAMEQSYAALRDAMTQVLPKDTLQSLACVDVFRHKSLPQGRQAWLMRFRFQHMERTLTGAEVDGWIAKALEAARTHGAELRG
ncbi:phenylalanine--tRNA ligase subunit beta [Holophaga foetida]|uniref:phenylalanine--tRNA ligase subunit beta n=1 Tax=Holophaga foetida TaxID=35839 RepID=UPI00024721C3|nr:phenylalanine--tRNA ligase subunit beta [Holophaga foetida]